MSRTLKEFRHTENFKQIQVANAVGSTQPDISEIERAGATCTYNHHTGALAIYERGLLTYSGVICAVDEDL